MTTKPSKREHDFTLVLTGLSELSTESIDALYAAGCDDATLAVRCGRVFATFSRSAESLKDAIVSAVLCVRRAGIGADVLRVDHSNLVTQADIARRIGRSRQLVHQYMTGNRGPGGFPGPVCEVADDTWLWQWCEVAYWLWQNEMIKEDVLREAEEVGTINSALEMEWQKKTRRDLTESVIRAISST